MEKLTDDWILAHQDKYRYWKFEKLRLGLILASVGFGLAYVLLRRQSLLLTILCLLIPSVCAVLDFCFPAYFTLMHFKWEMDRNTRTNRISLVAPFFFSLGFLALATHLNFHFVSLAGLLFSGLVLAMIVTAVFLLILPECRGNIREMVVFLVLIAVMGFGITGQANYWLDSRETEVVQAVVTEIENNDSGGIGHRKVASDMLTELMGVIYTCEAALPDGTRAKFSMAQVGNIRIGESVTLIRINGALGLECYILGKIQ